MKRSRAVEQFWIAEPVIGFAFRATGWLTLAMTRGSVELILSLSSTADES